MKNYYTGTVPHADNQRCADSSFCRNGGRHSNTAAIKRRFI